MKEEDAKNAAATPDAAAPAAQRCGLVLKALFGDLFGTEGSE